MNSLRNQTIPQQLNSAQKLIETSQDTAAILAIMLKFGYTPADFTAAHTLYTKAVAANKKASADGSDAELATAMFHESMVTARDRYADFAKIGRAAYKGNQAVLGLLRLDKRRPKAVDNFIIAADQLYDTTKWSQPVKTKLGQRGVNDQWLSTARGEVEELKTARKLQTSLGGDAEVATQGQTDALEELVDWCQEYIDVTRVAFKKTPQTLEKLGIKVRNTKSKAQIAGRKKAATTRAANRAAKLALKAKAA